MKQKNKQTATILVGMADNNTDLWLDISFHITFLFHIIFQKIQSVEAGEMT